MAAKKENAWEEFAFKILEANSTYKIEREEWIKNAVRDGLGLLYYDIETSLMEVYTHYIGNKVFISPNQIKVPSRVISIQYMFEGDKKAKFIKWEKTNKGFSDAKMLEEFVTKIL